MEWVAVPFSRRSSQHRDRTQVFYTAGRFFTVWATREARKLISPETICSLDILLSQFWTGPFFHVWFWLLLLCLHTCFSAGRSGVLLFPSLEEFSIVCFDPHSQRIWPSQWHRSRYFSGILLLLLDPTDVGNLIFGSSAFSKSSLYIWKFSVHVLLKPSLEDFEHYLAVCEMKVIVHCAHSVMSLSLWPHEL